MGKITRQELNTSVVSDLQNGKEAKEEIVQARGKATTLNARISTVENDQEVDHDALVDVTNELVDARGGESDLKTYLDATKSATQNALNNVDNKIGILSTLNTTNKSSTVGAINEINTSLTNVSNEVVTARGASSSLNVRLNGMDSNISAGANSITTLTNEVTTARGTYSTLNGRINNLENLNDNNSDALTDILSDLNNAMGLFPSLSAKLDSIISRIQALEDASKTE